MTDSFVFYKSYFEGISTLPEDQQLKLYQSLFGYLFREEEPTVSGVSYGMLQLILPTAQAAIERRESAQKAVNARWQKEKKEEEPAKQGEEPSSPRPAKQEAPKPQGEKPSGLTAIPSPSVPSQKEEPASTPRTLPQPAQRQHHLGKFHNVFLFDSEVGKLKEMFGERAKSIIEQFSKYKMEHRHTLLYDFPALIHFEKHGNLPEGMFEREAGSYAVIAPTAGTPPPN